MTLNTVMNYNGTQLSNNICCSLTLISIMCLYCNDFQTSIPFSFKFTISLNCSMHLRQAAKKSTKNIFKSPSQYSIGILY